MFVSLHTQFFAAKILVEIEIRKFPSRSVLILSDPIRSEAKIMQVEIRLNKARLDFEIKLSKITLAFSEMFLHGFVFLMPISVF